MYIFDRAWLKILTSFLKPYKRCSFIKKDNWLNRSMGFNKVFKFSVTNLIRNSYYLYGSGVTIVDQYKHSSLKVCVTVRLSIKPWKWQGRRVKMPIFALSDFWLFLEIFGKISHGCINRAVKRRSGFIFLSFSKV